MPKKIKNNGDWFLADIVERAGMVGFLYSMTISKVKKTTTMSNLSSNIYRMLRELCIWRTK